MNRKPVRVLGRMNNSFHALDDIAWWTFLDAVAFTIPLSRTLRLRSALTFEMTQNHTGKPRFIHSSLPRGRTSEAAGFLSVHEGHRARPCCSAEFHGFNSLISLAHLQIVAMFVSIRPSTPRQFHPSCSRHRLQTVGHQSCRGERRPITDATDLQSSASLPVDNGQLYGLFLWIVAFAVNKKLARMSKRLEGDTTLLCDKTHQARSRITPSKRPDEAEITYGVDRVF